MSAAAPGPQRQGPLTNLKVIEVCTTIAGPACARLLADFGADVIKIEPPEGDPGFVSLDLGPSSVGLGLDPGLPPATGRSDSCDGRRRAATRSPGIPRPARSTP